MEAAPTLYNTNVTYGTLSSQDNKDFVMVFYVNEPDWFQQIDVIISKLDPWPVMSQKYMKLAILWQYQCFSRA